jgi:hypothetical protein
MPHSSRLPGHRRRHVAVPDCRPTLRGGAMTVLMSLLAGLVTVIPSVSAEAQSTAWLPIPEVTVTAPRPPTAQELVGTAVPDFIRAHAEPAVLTGQLSRWRIGICPPVTVGLSQRFNEFISARILAVTVRVGAPVQTPEKCSRRNVYIVFTTEQRRHWMP